jgi:hypothetical protein
MLVTFGGFAAVALHAIYPLLVGLLLAAGYYFWRQHRAPLVLITPQETTVAKRSAWLAFIVWLFPGFLS